MAVAGAGLVLLLLSAGWSSAKAVPLGDQGAGVTDVAASGGGRGPEAEQRDRLPERRGTFTAIAGLICGRKNRSVPADGAAAAAIVEDGRWLRSLRDELQALLAPVFCQARSRLTAFAYVDGLLAEPGDRRSCWQLAEAAGRASPRRM